MISVFIGLVVGFALSLLFIAWDAQFFSRVRRPAWRRECITELASRVRAGELSATDAIVAYEAHFKRRSYMFGAYSNFAGRPGKGASYIDIFYDAERRWHENARTRAIDALEYWRGPRNLRLES